MYNSLLEEFLETKKTWVELIRSFPPHITILSRRKDSESLWRSILPFDRPASSDGLLLNFLSIINLLRTRTVCSVDEAFMLNTITVYF